MRPSANIDHPYLNGPDDFPNYSPSQYSQESSPSKDGSPFLHTFKANINAITSPVTKTRQQIINENPFNRESPFIPRSQDPKKEGKFGKNHI